MNDLDLERSNYLMTPKVHASTVLEVEALLLVENLSNIQIRNSIWYRGQELFQCIVYDVFLLFGDFFPNGMRNSVKMYPSSVITSCSSAGYPSCLIRSGFVWIYKYVSFHNIDVSIFSYLDLPHVVPISMNLEKIFCLSHLFRCFVITQLFVLFAQYQNH